MKNSRLTLKMEPSELLIIKLLISEATCSTRTFYIKMLAGAKLVMKSTQSGETASV